MKKLKKLRNYGSKIKYHNELIGYNSRLDELQAYFLSIKLRNLNEINNHKRKLAGTYFSNLKEDYIKPIIVNGYVDIYHIYNIRFPKRDALKEYLLKNGIKQKFIILFPPHKQTALKSYFAVEDFPISELIHNTTLSLPISYSHSETDILKVIEVMNSF